jgi:biopolymer transport protein ExbD
MARSRPGNQKIKEAEMDMTPIIDVVFNLVIFFMLTANMVQAQIVKLELPAANESDTKKQPDPNRLVVNIVLEGHIFIAGQNMTDNQGELERLLRNEAADDMDSTGKFSNKAVLVRVDKGCPYDKVQAFMQLCTKHKIWKLEFAALKEDTKQP